MNIDWKKVWEIVKNRYVAATLIFLLLILFIDQNNLFVIGRLHREVSQLRKESDEARSAVRTDSIHINSLINNIDSVERFGREEYLMKRSDEDVFIFNDEY